MSKMAFEIPIPLGGITLAPLLDDGSGLTAAFNPFSPLIAFAVAVTCLTIGNLRSNPFGVDAV